MSNLVRNLADRFSRNTALECLPCTPTGGIEKFGTVDGAGRVIGKVKSTGSCVEDDGNCEVGATVVPEVTINQNDIKFVCLISCLMSTLNI